MITADERQRERTRWGKWGRQGVPHKGWFCVEVIDLENEDLEDPEIEVSLDRIICEICEAASIRFVHIMKNSDYPGTLHCGCVCAGNMENDLVGAHRREADFRNRQKQRAGWLNHRWRVSQSGNEWRMFKGLRVVVFQKGCRFSGIVTESETERSFFTMGSFKTSDEAKLAALDIALSRIEG